MYDNEIFEVRVLLEILFSSTSAIWLIAIVVFLILEAVTIGLTSIWLALGALAALIAALFGAPWWLQVIWFFVIAIVSLILTRPLVQKYINSKSMPTNADMVIGMDAIVKEDIDNLTASGTVSAGGKIWTARSASGERIAAGTIVRAERIEGVKLIVRPAGAPAEECE